MNIKINSEEELIQLAANAVHILANLRRTTKEWNEHFGAPRRERKQYWEGKADELIQQLDAQHLMHHKQIKIEINNGTEI